MLHCQDCKCEIVPIHRRRLPNGNEKPDHALLETACGIVFVLDTANDSMENLNQPQLEAASSSAKQMIILAGPGSGTLLVKVCELNV